MCWVRAMTPTTEAAERRGSLANRITNALLTALGIIVIVFSFYLVGKSFSEPWPGTWPFVFGFAVTAFTILVLARISLITALLCNLTFYLFISDGFIEKQQLGCAAFVVALILAFVITGTRQVIRDYKAAVAEEEGDKAALETGSISINELRDAKGLPPIEHLTIVPELDKPERIAVGLYGYAGAGKDTAAEYLVDEHGFTRVSFADKIREFALAVDDHVPVIVPGLGDEPDQQTWMRLSEFLESQGHDWTEAKKNLEVRRMLQRLGTEGGRFVLGENVWVDAALADLPPGNLVFTDMRFPNEYEAIVHRLKGIAVRINRPGVAPVNAHASDSSLDDHLFHANITNAGTPEELGFTLAKFVGAFTGEPSLLA